MVDGVPGKPFSALGIIPARYKSSRFPGKTLTLINGIPMIKRTFLQASKSDQLDKLIVATDDLRISDYCNSENIPVVMTSDDCLTGTDRLAEVVEMDAYNNFDIYINIQGDEPVIDPLAIKQIVDLYQNYPEGYMAYNLYKIITDLNEINSNTIIKVIVNENDDLLYMSRLPVPYSNSDKKSIYKQQIPVYGYTKKALKLFSNSNKTINEQFEDIELLRFIDLGHKIKMKETIVMSVSVDVPTDLKKIENILTNVK